MRLRALVLGLAAAVALGACDPHDWNDPNRGGANAGDGGLTAQAEVLAAIGLVDADGIIDNSVQEKLNGDRALCASVGGENRPVCMMQKPMCVVTFADAGADCTDGSGCKSGRCLGDMSAEFGVAATGTCAPSNDPCGCFALVEDGEAQPGLCVD